MTPRRAVLAGLAALSLAGPVAAAAKVVEAKKVFPFLDVFLKIPPADRNRFRLVYTFRSAGKPLAAQVWLIDGGPRTPMPLRADGRADRLPTLAQLDRGKIEIGVDAGTKISVGMTLEPTTVPAAELDARDLAAAIAQASTGVRKGAGIMALAIPKMQAVAFHGVTSGEVEFADGRRATLPIKDGTPTYTPTAQPAAKTLRFARPPARITIE